MAAGYPRHSQLKCCAGGGVEGTRTGNPNGPAGGPETIRRNVPMTRVSEGLVASLRLALVAFRRRPKTTRAAAYEKTGTTMTCHRQGSALKARLATGVPAQHTREDGVRR